MAEKGKNLVGLISGVGKRKEGKFEKVRQEDIENLLGVFISSLVCGEMRKAEDKARVLYEYDCRLSEDMLELKLRIRRALMAFLIKRGCYNKASDLGLQTLSLLETYGYVSGYANILYHLGEVNLKLGNLNEAEEYLLDAVSAFRKEENYDGVARSYNLLAKAHKDKSRFLTALEFLERAIYHARKAKLYKTLGLLYVNRAVLWIKLGFIPKAVEALRQATEYYTMENPEIFNKIQLECTRALICLTREELEEAKGILEGINEDIEQLRDPRVRALYCELKGIYYLKKHRYEEAENYFVEALSIGESIASSSDIINQVDRLLGDLYFKLDKLQKAEEKLRSSLSVSEELGDLYEKALALKTLGLIEERKGNLEKALERLMEAHNLLTSIGEKLEKAKISLEIARILAVKGAQRALAYAVDAEHSFKENKVSYWICKSKLVLAFVYYKLEEYCSALSELDEAETLAKKLGIDEFIQEGRMLRTEIDSALVNNACSQMTSIIKMEELKVESVQLNVLLTNFINELGAEGILLAKVDDSEEISIEKTVNIKADEIDTIFEKLKKVQNDSGPLWYSSSDNHVIAPFKREQGRGYIYIKGNSKPFGNAELLNILRLSKLIEYLYLTEFTEVTSSESRKKFVAINANVGSRKIVTQNVKMLQILEFIDKIKDIPLPVLIYGETGTGKELIARYIHAKSNRAKNPFVPVNCANIPTTILESELFGFKKGAFTDAYEDRKGWFEVADGGTLFLDEIAEAGKIVQAKLLRFLEDKVIVPLGSRKPRKVDVRILAATNKRLGEEVRNGRFREDLYYRLKGIIINLPPLRERKDDIPLLVEYFLERVKEEFSLDIKGIENSALKLLLEYNWPGNVRELENVIKTAAVHVGSGQMISRSVIQMLIDAEVAHGALCELRDEVKDIEKKRIEKVLAEVGWNKTKAARILGMSRQNLILKIKKYGIKQPAT